MGNADCVSLMGLMNRDDVLLLRPHLVNLLVNTLTEDKTSFSFSSLSLGKQRYPISCERKDAAAIPSGDGRVKVVVDGHDVYTLPVTRAMCRKPPAVKGRTHEVMRPSANSELLVTRAVRAPAMPIVAVPNWAFAASHRPNPVHIITRWKWKVIGKIDSKRRIITSSQEDSEIGHLMRNLVQQNGRRCQESHSGGDEEWCSDC